MEQLYVMRQKLQESYAVHSKLFDKGIQFVLALATFFLINKNIGVMELAAQPFVTFALAVICTFFPMGMTVIVSGILILTHIYSLSLGMALVTLLVFVVMFALYLRLTPRMSMVVLLSILAFILKIPYVIPITYALVYGPVCIVAICCGTIVFYMIDYVKKVVPVIQAGESAGLMSEVSSYVKQVFLNKELWVVTAAFMICFLVVYTVRRQSIDHAWKIAIVSGAVINVIVITAGDIALGVSTSFGMLMAGSILAIGIGLVLELFYFSVDYARSEKLQYEDDDYYYYVKAVPKLSIAAPVKTVKRINEREETEIIDKDKMRQKTSKKNRTAKKGFVEEESFRKKKSEERKKSMKKSSARREELSKSGKHVTKRGPSVTKQEMTEVDKILLTKSLRDELDI